MINKEILTMKILIIGDKQYAEAFCNFKNKSFVYARDVGYNLDSVSDISLACFTGGHDIDPSMYEEERHYTTASLLERDAQEAVLYQQLKDRGIPMVGICRGSQFLTVMNGGKLVQHVNNHAIAGMHEMTGMFLPMKEGDELTKYTFSVTSTHHQMMYPYNLPSDQWYVVGFSNGLSTFYEGLPNDERKCKRFLDYKGRKHRHIIEPEVVWYPRTHSLGFQYHPEYMKPGSSGVSFFQKAIEHYLFNVSNKEMKKQ